MKLLAVTACPTGIAHTYIAAEKLKKTAADLGITIKVETRGSIGVENEITPEEIMEADGVIIAADKDVEKERFRGKRVLECSVADAIHKTESLIKRFQDGEVPVYKDKTEKADAAIPAEGKELKQESKVKRYLYRDLMNGVSFMIPFVVIGGLLIAISIGLGGVPTDKGFVIPEHSLWKTINDIGTVGFQFMVPILAGFIAMSIADRPGLAPGMIGGYIAANGSFYGSAAGAGFIGGIVAGFIAGYIAKGLKALKVPKMIQPIMPILVIPLLTSLAVSLIFIYIIGAPISALMEALTHFLNTMQGASKIVLALILGAMITFDMGGPINKVAFLFGAAMIGQGNPYIMGPIATAICIPPLGMGLATLLNKRKYYPEEQEAGKAALAMGLVGITEGAIPFASRDPLRVIPSIMAGGMVGSVISMLGHVGDSVPHGGPIVMLFSAIHNIPMFIIGIIAGVLVTAFMVNALKKPVSDQQ
ncbi:PTS transporter subunit EIIC [Thermoactinomyces sp. CICC 10521]|jgi:fructose PTS system EIIBC or EIIC component|uniref:PTS fructose transporter subunit IIC n=1 Tax=Thermoactinomyces daqus TaxID=1329516 RepID=UPI00051A6FAB|nr:PTS transporter subunit EIIC [Thermoactinomyces sp. CICC 10521]